MPLESNPGCRHNDSSLSHRTPDFAMLFNHIMMVDEICGGMLYRKVKYCTNIKTHMCKFKTFSSYFQFHLQIRKYNTLKALQVPCLICGHMPTRSLTLTSK